MRKLIVPVVLILMILFIGFNAKAANLESMTLEELLNLRNAINEEIDRNHKANSTEQDKVLEITKSVTGSHFEKLGLEISWAWLNYEYTKDWGFFTLRTHIDFRDASGTKRKPEVYSEVLNASGSYQLVFLQVGEETLVDQRASLPSGYKSSKGTTALPLAGANEPLKVISVTPPPTIKISAADLIKAYDNNEVKADADYKGKLLEVKGKVANVRTSWGSTIVEIGTGSAFEWGIYCYLAKDQNDKAAQLDKDDSITVVGKCDGLSFLSVSMIDCEIK